METFVDNLAIEVAEAIVNKLADVFNPLAMAHMTDVSCIYGMKQILILVTVMKSVPKLFRSIASTY